MAESSGRSDHAPGSEGRQPVKPGEPDSRKKPAPETEEAELGPEIQHGQLSNEELNSRNDG